MIAATIGMGLGLLSAAGTARAAVITETPLPEPSGTTFSRATALSCTTATACTIVGTYRILPAPEKPIAWRWNGSAWSMQTVPVGPETDRSGVLESVSCTSATACVAVGFSFSESASPALGTPGFATRWDGRTWTQQTLPDPPRSADPDVGPSFAGLQGVSCSGLRACTAVGIWNASGSSSGGTLRYRFNGTSWTAQAAPVDPSGTYQDSAGMRELSGVSCPTATACIAVAPYYRAAFAQRWNGGAWTLDPMPLPSQPPGTPPASYAGPRQIACTSATACTAVGGWTDGNFDSRALAWRWNGRTWTPQTVPVPPDPQPSSQLNGVSCPSATVCLAVGFASGAPNGLAVRWNGTSWSIVPIQTRGSVSAPPTSLVCASATRCMVSGSSSDAENNSHAFAGTVG